MVSQYITWLDDAAVAAAAVAVAELSSVWTAAAAAAAVVCPELHFHVPHPDSKLSSRHPALTSTLPR